MSEQHDLFGGVATAVEKRRRAPKGDPETEQALHNIKQKFGPIQIVSQSDSKPELFPGSERVEFTGKEIDRIAQLAQQKEQWGANPLAKYRDGVELHVDGLRGEWAVAKSLGHARMPASLEPDEFDLVLVDNVTAQIKYSRSHALEWFVLSANHETLGAHVGILVLADKVESRECHIVSWITDEAFENLKQQIDLGSGPRWAVKRSSMKPWALLKETIGRIQYGNKVEAKSG